MKTKIANRLFTIGGYVISFSFIIEALNLLFSHIMGEYSLANYEVSQIIRILILIGVGLWLYPILISLKKISLDYFKHKENQK